MIGQRTMLRQTAAAAPLRRVRETLVAAAIVAGSGALGTTAGFARDTPDPQSTTQTNEYVLPGRQVMREMRAVIIALYGPRPAATERHELDARPRGVGPYADYSPRAVVARR